MYPKEKLYNFMFEHHKNTKEKNKIKMTFNIGRINFRKFPFISM